MGGFEWRKPGDKGYLNPGKRKRHLKKSRCHFHITKKKRQYEEGRGAHLETSIHGQASSGPRRGGQRISWGTGQWKKKGVEKQRKESFYSQSVKWRKTVTTRFGQGGQGKKGGGD